MMFKRKNKTGCETPTYSRFSIAPEPKSASKPNPNYVPPASVANPKEERLVNCFCGGKVELTGGTYGYPTYKVECLRCGGIWSMGTYSPKEAIERWNAEHNRILRRI